MKLEDFKEGRIVYNKTLFKEKAKIIIGYGVLHNSVLIQYCNPQLGHDANWLDVNRPQLVKKYNLPPMSQRFGYYFINDGLAEKFTLADKIKLKDLI